MLKRIYLNQPLLSVPATNIWSQGLIIFHRDHSPTWPSLASFHTFSTLKPE